MKLGIIPNINKDKDLNVTRSILLWFANKDAVLMLESDIAEKLGYKNSGFSREKIYSSSDVVIVLGGDGTLLNIARQSARYDVPLFGINLGHLGFLAEAEISDMYLSLDKIMEGDYNIEKRMMLEALVEDDENNGKEFLALNDFSVTKGMTSRMITISTYINDSFFELYSADGVVISSPTGSTAYSLSAGGPIVSPELKVLIITPICPHTIHNRSIVVSEKDEVKIVIGDENPEVMLSVDGQDSYRLNSGKVVRIRSSSFVTNLVKLKQRSFFDVLRRKISER
ncbi:MAG TPA: NAD(+)/NADH kinase [Bacillota bacterium]|nr:NAD(+)/NADH kinase [Bacillota bacterium]HNT02681.1 NAD(+)/NADH kinase [Bacillota bacterium]HPA54639.1 NAD(+)/NADH kinase [Bacillota bacterium]HPX68679.1 NAD(+)/NADH kinase [Bacillota bacterium]HQA64715.1 NAD(+)/NADH kinase [Bacillota bacterium]